MENEKIENDTWFAGTSPRYTLQAAKRGEWAMHPFGKGGMVTYYPKEGWSVPNIVMSDGMTVWERVEEPIALEYQSGKTMPFLLEGPRP